MVANRLIEAAQPLVGQARSLLVRLWGGTTLGVRAMAFDEGRVLLVRHTYVSGWHFPGGGVHARETAEAAARRELLEETGYEAAGPARFLGLYFNPAMAGRDHVALYHVPVCSVRRAFIANREIAEIGLFPTNDLPEGTTAATRRRLAEMFEGLPHTDRW
ncbi:DNA mismatch repair protein MutT [Pleomorphomonas diazotrophica]|uniref:DNA mismatch repair protein MutT n=1 Tax=Pleomorphomonas diazotrophica TaxID=1166257 RepID=A0A1I4RJH0_9HYPH|nr:NUDIX domain-containing protein [Pleomorphomonas diazotrophica]PKR87528.1 DNA mismatch repair protein MutT [Pleomorphomonas diazotrophica]SFM52452.1 ADP-ribose pyrophosphatase YjhB, NUDIX family [Pleomorphomonas diazotrophica]